MIQTIALFAGVIGWFVTFLNWYEIPYHTFLYIAGGLTLWFLFQLMAGGGQNKQLTVAFAAPLIFFSLSLSEWTEQKWEDSHPLSVLFEIDPFVVGRIVMILSAIAVIFLTFVFGHWAISYFGRRDKARRTQTDSLLQRFLKRMKRQREIKKKGIPSVVLGKVEKFK